LKRASVRTAGLFLAFYSAIDPTWNYTSPPSGVRGKYGDKLLCEELSKRYITLHDNITAYGENLGWKGNMVGGGINLETDPRFKDFISSIKNATSEERVKTADYLAQKFAESRRETQPLPPVGPEILTYARARLLFYRLITTPSEGHIQQFLVAALLREHRKRYSIDVVTHHPHGADKYDNTAGDIEEKLNGQLIRAYEVTVRDDWQNRISRFKSKMDEFGLPKYIIIASGVNNDLIWSIPANMLASIEPYGRDIAVVDIHDFINVFAAELTASELRSVINGVYTDLSNPKLSNIEGFKETYRAIVSEWLDSI
jgi:hypothetical protein